MAEDKYYFEREEFSNPNFEFSFPFDSNLLKDILTHKKSGKVLDLGCGEGGTSLELAKRGFDVTCIDISKTAIEAIKKEAISRNIKINAICADLEDYSVKENYDIIIAKGFFHFLPMNKVLKLIENCKRHTNKGGINILDILTGKEFFKEGEIKEIYSNWTIEDFESYKEDLGIMNYLFGVKKG